MGVTINKKVNNNRTTALERTADIVNIKTYIIFGQIPSIYSKVIERNTILK